MVEAKQKIFLAPHNDDEALFGAFSIMRENPLVVVVTDSYAQRKRGRSVTPEQRQKETLEAMTTLGATCCFLGIKDTKLTKRKLRKKLIKLAKSIKDIKEVYAPMIEGGNWMHDLAGETAIEVFNNVLHYSTYTINRPYPVGDIEIKPTEEERKTKVQILSCYHSQKNHRDDRTYFQYARTANEYFNSSPVYDFTGTLKQRALQNLIDFKKALDRLKIPFCLMDGTLLGAYRDCDFIENDYDDTDIGIPEKYRSQAPEIFAELEKQGLKKIKQSEFSKGFNGGKVARGGNHIDFFCISKKGKEAYNLGRNFLPGNKKPYMAYVYPAYCFEKFDQLIFKGMKINIPNKVEDFLQARYGDWQTPIQRNQGFNWLNIKQNPCLRIDFEI